MNHLGLLVCQNQAPVNPRALNLSPPPGPSRCSRSSVTASLISARDSSVYSSRFSSFITERSCTCFASISSADMKVSRCITEWRSRISKSCWRSIWCSCAASQSESRWSSSRSILSNSARSMKPSVFMSISLNSSRSLRRLRAFFVRDSSSTISFRYVSVAWIMFSLTTAVRIDSTAHEERTTKIINAIFEMGSESKTGLKGLRWPFMMAKSTKMDSGTLSKVLATSSGGSPP
mmetsp:Transcript_52443/g.149465  ORF Transcript_52443/g.149465 Transcript_52443/m.149465 type:complete len:233 (-) Transcript_52443:1375-2073(-)